MTVICWSTWYLSQYWLPRDVTSIDWKVFSRAFGCHWDCENCWRINGNMAKWSLWHIVCTLLSYVYYVTHHVTSCDMTLWLPTMWLWHLWCDTFPHSLLCSKSKIKEKKRNINNDLAVLPSHDTFHVFCISLILFFELFCHKKVTTK